MSPLLVAFYGYARTHILVIVSQLLPRTSRLRRLSSAITGVQEGSDKRQAFTRDFLEIMDFLLAYESRPPWRMIADSDMDSATLSDIFIDARYCRETFYSTLDVPGQVGNLDIAHATYTRVADKTLDLTDVSFSSRLRQREREREG